MPMICQITKIHNLKLAGQILKLPTQEENLQMEQLRLRLSVILNCKERNLDDQLKAPIFIQILFSSYNNMVIKHHKS